MSYHQATKNEGRPVPRAGLLALVFLAQPFPLPEDLLAVNPIAYYFRGGCYRFNPEVLAGYLRCVHRFDTIHTMCEDYRAGVTFDVEHDEADRGNKRIACPVVASWERFDVLDIESSWAYDIRGNGLDCGHYVVEEKPNDAHAELEAFFIG